MNAHPLRVSAVEPEAGGIASSITFDVPTELHELYSWKPGQHATLLLEIDGRSHSRTYTISAPPLDNHPLRITVKRVPDGLVSNHLCDTIKPGDEITAAPPAGVFTLEPGASLHRTHYFLAAGSGITPIYAMLHAVCAQEPHSTAHLIYGNTNAKSIIFSDALAHLADRSPERVTVSHVLSKPKLLDTFTPWRTGIIDANAIRAWIDAHPPYAQDARYYICGPGTMNADSRTALMHLDVPADRIYSESFSPGAEPDTSSEGVHATASITIEGEQYAIPVEAGETLLLAAQRAGINPPFSCGSGVCGTCRARLFSGTVHSRAQMALLDQQIKAGDILTCQSVPTSPTVELQYL